jgi:hypothetical protein
MSRMAWRSGLLLAVPLWLIIWGSVTWLYGVLT